MKCAQKQNKQQDGNSRMSKPALKKLPCSPNEVVEVMPIIDVDEHPGSEAPDDDELTPRPRRAAAVAATAKLADVFHPNLQNTHSAAESDNEGPDANHSSPRKSSPVEKYCAISININSDTEMEDNDKTPKAHPRPAVVPVRPSSPKSKVSRMKAKDGRKAPIKPAKSTKRKADETPSEGKASAKKVHIDISDSEIEEPKIEPKEKLTKSTRKGKGQKGRISKAKEQFGKLRGPESTPRRNQNHGIQSKKGRSENAGASISSSKLISDDVKKGEGMSLKACVVSCLSFREF